MRFSSDKSIERSAKALIKSGWSYRRGGNHIILKSPNGYTLPIPGSPSCGHAARNWHNAVRKIQQGVKS